MPSGITTFTAIKLDDKDVSDFNSGFYTTQATTDQINNIPADAKEEGELLYNKTTGNLMLFNGTWNTLNSYPGFTRPLIAVYGSNDAGNSTIEGEQIYYMPLDSDSVYILKAQDFTLPDPTKNEIIYTGTNSIVVHYTVALGIVITPTSPITTVTFNLYLNRQHIIDRIVLYEVIAGDFHRLTFTRSTALNPGDVISCGIETADVAYNLYGINMTVMSI